MFLITLPIEPAAVPTCVCTHNNNRVSRPRHALPHAARVRVPVATPVDTGQDVESFTCMFGGQARMHSHHIPPAWKGPEANRRRKISTRYGNTHPERGPDF